MIEINLLPKDQRKQSGTSIWTLLTWGLLPITAAAVFIPILVTSGKAADLHRKIEAEEGNIAALTPQKNKYDELIAKQKALEEVTKTAQGMRDSKTYWSNDLASFSAEISAGGGISLKSLKMSPFSPDALATAHSQGIYKGKEIRREMLLGGTASSEQAVVSFLSKFENSPNFSAVLDNVKLDEVSKLYTFGAKIGIVGDAPVSAEAQNSDATGAAATTPAATGGSAAPAPALAPAISPAARGVTP